MEDDLNIFVNGRRPPILFFKKQCNLKQIKNKPTQPKAMLNQNSQWL
jgi:hypothetical protein